MVTRAVAVSVHLISEVSSGSGPSLWLRPSVQNDRGAGHGAAGVAMPGGMEGAPVATAMATMAASAEESCIVGTAKPGVG